MKQRFQLRCDAYWRVAFKAGKRFFLRNFQSLILSLSKQQEIIVIYLCIHGKWFPWDYVTKSRDTWVFKALLRIKKSFKSIDFDLGKHLLVSSPIHPTTSWVDFDWSRNYEITVIYLCIPDKRNLWDYVMMTCVHRTI